MIISIYNVETIAYFMLNNGIFSIILAPDLCNDQLFISLWSPGLHTDQCFIAPGLYNDQLNQEIIDKNIDRPGQNMLDCNGNYARLQSEFSTIAMAIL